ncbi:MAG: phosphatidylserine/phosphatidylglycerophosphate/cardiolipin synthase family protein, partial [Gammaproteobacteria bacterium]
GCASQPSVSHDPYDHTAAHAIPDHSREIPRIDTAMLQERHLLVRYQADGEPLQAMATVESVIDDLLSTPGKTLPVKTLRTIPDDKWESLLADAMPVVVHGPETWRSLLNSSLQVLVPETGGHGVAVDILQQSELFLYRDENDMLVSVPMVFKPADVKITRSYEFTHLLEVMGQQLRARDQAGDRVLFETGDDSEYGYPFVYADTQTGQILFLRREPWGPAYADTMPLVTTVEILTRTITDHIWALFNQPVTSITRLFTIVSSSTVDLVRPTPLVLVEYGPIPPLNGGDGMNLLQWEARLDEITGTSPSSGRLTYLIDGAEFFPRMIEVINSARESVYLRVYIFDNDDYATEIADLLKQRSTTVDTRVLVDGLGTLGAEMARSSSLPPGHEPKSSITRYLEEDSDVHVRAVANVWLSGDHTKSIIIDNRIAFLGGMNIGREYRYDWHDMMIEVEGPIVNEISSDFQRAWLASGFLGDLQQLFYRDRETPVPASDADYPMRLLYTRPGNSQILRAQIAATRQARRYIYLQYPYITSDAMLYELVKARRRGVDVRVIIPYRIDNAVITRSNVLAANAMLRNGIRVYIYPGMSHLKAAIYDGWICLGSANMDNLSLRTNREMNLATSHPAAVDALREQVFDVDMENSVELTSPLPSNWLDYLNELMADSL